jgi:hypothetical protein
MNLFRDTKSLRLDHYSVNCGTGRSTATVRQLNEKGEEIGAATLDFELPSSETKVLDNKVAKIISSRVENMKVEVTPEPKKEEK